MPAPIPVLVPDPLEFPAPCAAAPERASDGAEIPFDRLLAAQLAAPPSLDLQGVNSQASASVEPQALRADSGRERDTDVAQLAAVVASPQPGLAPPALGVAALSEVPVGQLAPLQPAITAPSAPADAARDVPGDAGQPHSGRLAPLPTAPLPAPLVSATPQPHMPAAPQPARVAALADRFAVPVQGQITTDPQAADAASAPPQPTSDRSAEAPAPTVSVAAPLAQAERPEAVERAAALPAMLHVAAPVGTRDFGQEVGARLVWMAGHGQQVAQLRVDPPQLGPVEVRLTITNDEASLAILSAHAQVRDAVQASLPRLQEMLQGIGLNLSSVFVGAEGFGHGSHPSQSTQPSHPLRHAIASGILDPGSPVLRSGVGLVDVYI
jgi:flagellar hook-length control protein FliK